MKKLLFISLAATLLYSATNAQSSYKSALGLRLSAYRYYNTAAANYKTFIGNNTAFDFGLGFAGKRYLFTGDQKKYNISSVALSTTYIYHFDSEVEGLKWTFGAGALLFVSSSKLKQFSGAGTGLYLAGGADYKFEKIPLNVAIDFRPTLHITSPSWYQDGNFYDLGVTARYILK